MILAATGHRPDKLGGYDFKIELRLNQLAVRHIVELKPTVVISGMALGWDMAVAEAALVAGVPFIAAIPFEGQELKWPFGSQLMYRALRAAAFRVEIVSPGGHAAWKMHERNRWMVDHADHILALWDGGKDGGTANCIEYAEKKKLPITNVWDEWTS